MRVSRFVVGASNQWLQSKSSQCERGKLTKRLLSGGWKIPKPDDTNLQGRQPAAEKIKIDIPHQQQSLEIRLRQRFTMAPGGNSGTGNDKTGTWVWPTTKRLLDYLLQQRTLSKIRAYNQKKSLRILELGAGCGLLGMALAASDKHTHVTLTDHEGNMDCLSQNLELNSALIQDRALAATLCWGNKNDMESLRGDFDLIIGSDLIYESKTHSALVKTISWFTRNSPVYLAYPYRELSCEKNFLELLGHEFHVTTTDLEVDKAALAICDGKMRSP